MNRKPHGPHHSQSGFSLVEILVAMTLGLILLGGTIVIYASSKNSYRLQENIAGMQENARYAILALRRDIELTGFFPGDNDNALFLTTAPNGTRDGGGNNSDQITIRYQSSTDCLGNATPDSDPDKGIAVNRYFINDDKNLACLGNGNNTPQPLVENIDNMQILYGVDTDGDSDGVANLYATATEVSNGIVTGTAAGTVNWDRVVSVRLALLVASDTAIDMPAATTTTTDSATAPSNPGSGTSYSTSRDFSLLDAPTITKDDGRIYRVFTATIPLRNRIL